MVNDKNRKKKMSLEDLDKKNIYSVPEAYFDKLSYSIQERIQRKETSWFEKLKVSPFRYAIPAFSILICLGIYLLLKPSGEQLAVNPKKDPILKDSLKKDTFKQNEKPIEHAPEDHIAKNKTDDKQNNLIPDEGTPLQPENKNPVDNNLAQTTKTAQEYLAEVSKEDIRIYLEMNDIDESQMEETILEN
jgi:hypothetical protein